MYERIIRADEALCLPQRTEQGSTMYSITEKVDLYYLQNRST